MDRFKHLFFHVWGKWFESTGPNTGFYIQMRRCSVCNKTESLTL